MAIIAIVTTFTSCEKGKDGAQGPAGAQGSSGNYLNSSGYIKGNISGVRTDGTPFDESFDYGQYPDITGIYTPTPISFHFERYSGFNSHCMLTVIPTNITDTTATISIDEFRFLKDIGGNKMFEFLLNGATTGSTTFSYNVSNGTVSGTFNIQVLGSNNSTGTVAVVKGTFSAVTKQMVHRQIKSGTNTL